MCARGHRIFLRTPKRNEQTNEQTNERTTLGRFGSVRFGSLCCCCCCVVVVLLFFVRFLKRQRSNQSIDGQRNAHNEAKSAFRSVPFRSSSQVPVVVAVVPFCCRCGSGCVVVVDQVSGFQLPVASCQLPVASRQSPVASCHRVLFVVVDLGFSSRCRCRSSVLVSCCIELRFSFGWSVGSVHYFVCNRQRVPGVSSTFGRPCLSGNQSAEVYHAGCNT